MYRKILVPLDGSELAEIAFAYSRQVAPRLGVDVDLLHVCNPLEREMEPMHRAYIERAAETVLRQSEETERTASAGSGSKELHVRGHLVTGRPAEEILRYADENSIDVILMATHGRSGIDRWAMGSVADKVLRSSKVPVWLVRSHVREYVHYGSDARVTILVPLDGSRLSESVLPHVTALAKPKGAEAAIDIVLLRVCEPPMIPADYPVNMPLTWEEHVERQKAGFSETCREYLVGVEKSLKGNGLSVRSEVPFGSPVDEIIKVAARSPLTLVVMATHGRSGLSRWAYGSIAERVLLGASCPMFLVRPDKSQFS